MGSFFSSITQSMTLFNDVVLSVTKKTQILVWHSTFFPFSRTLALNMSYTLSYKICMMMYAVLLLNRKH